MNQSLQQYFINLSEETHVFDLFLVRDDARIMHQSLLLQEANEICEKSEVGSPSQIPEMVAIQTGKLSPSSFGPPNLPSRKASSEMLQCLMKKQSPKKKRSSSWSDDKGILEKFLFELRQNASSSSQTSLSLEERMRGQGLLRHRSHPRSFSKENARWIAMEESVPKTTLKGEQTSMNHDD